MTCLPLSITQVLYLQSVMSLAALLFISKCIIHYQKLLGKCALILIILTVLHYYPFSGIFLCCTLAVSRTRCWLGWYTTTWEHKGGWYFVAVLCKFFKTCRDKKGCTTNSFHNSEVGKWRNVEEETNEPSFAIHYSQINPACLDLK